MPHIRSHGRVSKGFFEIFLHKNCIEMFVWMFVWVWFSRNAYFLKVLSQSRHLRILNVCFQCACFKLVTFLYCCTKSFMIVSFTHWWLQMVSDKYSCTNVALKRVSLTFQWFMYELLEYASTENITSKYSFKKVALKRFSFTFHDLCMNFLNMLQQKTLLVNILSQTLHWN